MNLKDQTILITGGAGGIGKYIVDNIASECKAVIMLDINDENFDHYSSSKTVNCYKCDVTDFDNVTEIIDKVFDDFPEISILVNNAGVSHIGNLEDTTEEAMDKVFKVNVKGAFYCLSEAVSRMKKTGGGRIVNIASSAVWVGISDRFAYSMSKAAVANMSLTVAKDYVNENIQSNSISPGRVHTPFVDQYLARHYPGQEKEMFEKLSKTQPIGRMASPDEIAYLALYLSSDEAGFITGSDYIIDGGMITLNT